MRFFKDKEYTFISHTQPFNVTFESDHKFHDLQCTKPFVYNEVLRWEVNNYRGFSAYDSPKCENRYGEYVKANYVLSLCRKSDVMDKETWVTYSNEEWAFETKKEMDAFLSRYVEFMTKGEKGEYGYYNRFEFKLEGGE